jgi:tetratricopeptide (TPR) repeat protein
LKVLEGEDNVAGILNNLGRFYCKRGNFREAEALYQRALALKEQRVGPVHRDNAMLLANYANMLRDSGREQEAAEAELKAHHIWHMNRHGYAVSASHGQ